MLNSSLCYLIRDNHYLMLHRVKKENDANHDKWIGIGGKFEDKESPEECMIREVHEETGLKVNSWHYHGIVTFVSDCWETEYMHLFTSDSFTGDADNIFCDEGVPEWIPIRDVSNLPQWEGDRLFLNLLQSNASFFSLKLVYSGDSLSSATLNGSAIPLPNFTNR